MEARSIEELRDLFKTVAGGRRYMAALLAEHAEGAEFQCPVVHGLVLAHPRCEAKNLHAVVSFSMRRRPPFSVRCLHTLFPDGTHDDVSYIQCLQAVFAAYDAKRHDRLEVTYALRTAISSTKRKAFLDAEGGGACAECGETEGPMQADHYPLPFAAIVDAFMASKGIALHGVEVARDQRKSNQVADPALRAEWVAFHDHLATFALLCPSCNTRAGTHGYKRVGGV